MTKGYIAKEINKVVETLMVHKGTRRQRVRAALIDIRLANACITDEPFWSSEFEPVASFLERVDGSGFGSVSEKQLQQVAEAFCKIDGLLHDWCKAK